MHPKTASLIHDDYVDQDHIWRYRPATWTLEGSRRAVLLGDLIFATAIQKLVEMSRGDGVWITQAIASMAKGVYQEPLNSSTLTHAISKGTYRPELYNHIIRLKPAPSLALHRSWERWPRRSPERCCCMRLSLVPA